MNSIERNNILQNMTKEQLETHQYSTIPLSKYFELIDGDKKLYFPGTYIVKRFGLNNRYLSTAYKRGYEINATIKSDGEFFRHRGHYYISLPTKINTLIINGYYTYQLKQKDNENDFDFIYTLSKNCKIGFFK